MTKNPLFFINTFFKQWDLFPDNISLFIYSISLYPNYIYSFLTPFSPFPDLMRALTVRKSWQKLKFLWRYAAGIDGHSYVYCWHFNNKWLSLHPVSKYSIKFQFLPIFFFYCIYCTVYTHWYLEIFILRNFLNQFFIFKYDLKVLLYNVD